MQAFGSRGGAIFLVRNSTWTQCTFVGSSHEDMQFMCFSLPCARASACGHQILLIDPGEAIVGNVLWSTGQLAKAKSQLEFMSLVGFSGCL